ncbi:creatinine amidohydrolase protein [Halorhabdus tiamatea SARL4B]|uniref:Creatinase n=1 Tax=Halorhabdus tiamatea SARL4B TaxID=1033806 RepID=F7PF91_9EURY|nr:creatininase family protein [Halorhabdus tiamatea]ERJ05721.1 creatinine amidohydrolase protein [Halorhabdus tiamatea SARL4B]CCQ33956.1 creatinase [Halorhabdus tiamatea SARL4B]
MHLTESTWPDADAVETDLAVLPVGSTEQHGPHAPLGTDAIIAEAVADAAVASFPGEVVVAPPLTVGVSEEHRAFPGSLWVSEDTFRATVRETVDSLAHHGWNRVVIVNGHGGNVGPLEEVCARISRHDDAYSVPFTWFDAVDPDDVSMGHAGPLETSVLEHVALDLIDENGIEAAREGAARRWGEWTSGVNLAYDVEEFAPNGVVGDPTAGSADLGEELLGSARDALVSLLEAVAERDLSGD